MLIREKEKPYLFIVIDRTAIKQDKGVICYKTIPIRVIIGKYISYTGNNRKIY
jgi:hypothetical protein